jgi:hypothetical protein
VSSKLISIYDPAATLKTSINLISESLFSIDHN